MRFISHNQFLASPTPARNKVRRRRIKANLESEVPHEPEEPIEPMAANEPEEPIEPSAANEPEDLIEPMATNEPEKQIEPSADNECLDDLDEPLCDLPVHSTPRGKKLTGRKVKLFAKTLQVSDTYSPPPEPVRCRKQNCVSIKKQLAQMKADYSELQANYERLKVDNIRLRAKLEETGGDNEGQLDHEPIASNDNELSEVSSKSKWPLIALQMTDLNISSRHQVQLFHFLRNQLPPLNNITVPGKSFINDSKLMMRTLLTIQRSEFISSANYLTLLVDKTSHQDKSFFALLIMNHNAEIITMGITSPKDGTGETIESSMRSIIDTFDDASNKIVAICSDTEKAQLKGNRLLIASLESMNSEMTIQQG